MAMAKRPTRQKEADGARFTVGGHQPRQVDDSLSRTDILMPQAERGWRSKST